MAILQISRITHRKGLQENLPQLDGAEFGWSLDERRLFIGNGTLEEGAPVIGNTEILTEFSDILALASTYTYKGERAGYIVNTGDTSEGDVVRSLQERFDEIVSVLAFGAKGDGFTDDTAAINRALFELFCRQDNEQIRRSLYFPAGVYNVSNAIKVPPHAKLHGDGITSSIIRYNETGNNAPGVVMTSDSDHQIGVELGNGGATPPVGIEMYHMSIRSDALNSLLITDSITESSFAYLTLQGPLGTAELNTDADNTAAVRMINSTGAFTSSGVTFNKMVTLGTTYGLDIVDRVRGVQFENSRMAFHYKGALIGAHTVAAGPWPDSVWPGIDITGINITRTVFDNIAQEGIQVGPPGGRPSGNTQSPLTRMCSSAFNVFYDVGNNFSTSPVVPVINFENETHVSIGDLFERTDAQNLIYSRVEINGTPCIALDSTHAIKLGLYEREVGLRSDIDNNTSGTLFTIQSTVPQSFTVDYVVKRDGELRNGNFRVVNNLATIEYDDDYAESADVGITLSATPNGSGTDVNFVANNSGADALLNFSIVRLDEG